MSGILADKKEQHNILKAVLFFGNNGKPIRAKTINQKKLVEAVRKNVSIDWAVKESARAKLRVIVRRLLRKYGYPPDKQEKATQTVLEQAELLCRDWA